MDAEMKINRNRNRLAMLSTVAFVILYLVGYAADNGLLMIASLVFLAASCILLLITNRCPHCGRYFSGIYWSRPNAGYCSRCGQLMEFDR